MEFNATNREEAIKELTKMLDDFANEAIINGKYFNKNEADRYNKIVHLCIDFFQNKNINAKKIEIGEPTKGKPYVGVTIYIDEFELTAANKNEFIELIKMADVVIFYGDEENYFHLTFYVNDIYTE